MEEIMNDTQARRKASRYKILQIIPAPKDLIINYNDNCQLLPVCLALVEDEDGTTYVATVDFQGDVKPFGGSTHIWNIDGVAMGDGHIHNKSMNPMIEMMEGA